MMIINFPFSFFLISNHLRFQLEITSQSYQTNKGHGLYFFRSPQKSNTGRKFGSFLARVKNGGVLEMAYHARFADKVCFANFNLKGGKMRGDRGVIPH